MWFIPRSLIYLKSCSIILIIRNKTLCIFNW